MVDLSSPIRDGSRAPAQAGKSLAFTLLALFLMADIHGTNGQACLTRERRSRATTTENTKQRLTEAMTAATIMDLCDELIA